METESAVAPRPEDVVVKETEQTPEENGRLGTPDGGESSAPKENGTKERSTSSGRKEKKDDRTETGGVTSSVPTERAERSTENSPNRNRGSPQTASPTRARAGQMTSNPSKSRLAKKAEEEEQTDWMKVAVSKTLAVQGQTLSGPFGDGDNLLQFQSDKTIENDDDRSETASTVPPDFGQTSVQKLLQASSDGAATELCAVLHVSSQMFQDHRHKRLRNLAQVMLHMKQPTKYLEEVPVYLEPVPKDGDGNPRGEQVPAFRVMAGVPLEVTVMFDKSVPHVNSRVNAILGIEVVPHSTVYLRPKTQKGSCRGWCEAFTDMMEPEAVCFAPFAPDDVEIDPNDLTTANIMMNIPEDCGPRGELMMMRLKIHFAYERKAPIGMSSAKLSTEQLVYFTVYKNGSGTMQKKDTYQSPQTTLVNATIDLEVVAASAGVLLCPPIDLPMQMNYTSGRGDKFKQIGAADQSDNKSEVSADTHTDSNPAARGSKWSTIRWNPWSKKDDDPPKTYTSKA